MERSRGPDGEVARAGWGGRAGAGSDSRRGSPAPPPADRGAILGHSWLREAAPSGRLPPPARAKRRGPGMPSPLACGMRAASGGTVARIRGSRPPLSAAAVGTLRHCPGVREGRPLPGRCLRRVAVPRRGTRPVTIPEAPWPPGERSPPKGPPPPVPGPWIQPAGTRGLAPGVPALASCPPRPSRDAAFWQAAGPARRLREAPPLGRPRCRLGPSGGAEPPDPAPGVPRVCPTIGVSWTDLLYLATYRW
jgi:hypothetical protein